MLLKVMKIFTILLLLLSVSFGYAQTDCLTKIQLINLQSKSITEISNFLNKTGWYVDEVESDEVLETFGYSFNYNVVSWVKNYSNRITIYNDGESNIVFIKTSTECYAKLKDDYTLNNNKYSQKSYVSGEYLITEFTKQPITFQFKERDRYDRSIVIFNSKKINEKIKAIEEAERQEAERIRLEAEEEARMQRFCDSLVAYGDSLYKLMKYELAITKYTYVISNSCIDYTSIDIEGKIDKCRKEICEKSIVKGDSLFRIKQYDEALNLYLKNKDCSKYPQSLQEKINITRIRIIDEKIIAIKNIADKYFNEKKYDLALDQYNAIILIDNSNAFALKRIEQIQDIKDLIVARKFKTFSYKELNNTEFVRFQNTLINDVNAKIDKYEKGFLNFNYLISFDTLGTNLSSVKDISTSIKEFETYFESISKSEILTPVFINSYFLRATENVYLNLKWHTDKVSYKSKSKGISSRTKQENQNNDLITKFINKQSFNYGKYKFEIKQKNVLDNVFTDISLVKYKTVGPSAVFLSMILPGTGTLKVTYGEKGRGRITSFLLFSGLAVGAKLYSDGQFERYLDATEQSEMDKYYNIANTSHQIALISGGISGIIYLNDIFSVLSRGVKNKRASKSLRRQLRNGPIQIQHQPITLE